MRKYNLIFLSMILLQFGMASCNKCNQKQFSSQKLSEQDLNINPYSGEETLVFKDLVGDSIVYIGEGRKTEQSKYFSNDPNGDEVMKYDCFGNYYYSDANSTWFQSQPNKNPFALYVYFANEFETGSRDRQIAFEINNQNPSVLYSHETFSFLNDSIFNSPNFPNNKVLAYFNSYQLGNTTYKKVYKIGGASGNYLYYTVEDGLVGFVTKQFTLYCLQN